MNEKKETLKISKKELEQLEKAKDLLLSPDFETRYLGYSMFINNSFYQRCNPKSITLLSSTQMFLYDTMNSLKDDLLKNNSKIPVGLIWYIEHRFLKNLNNLYKVNSVKLLIPKEELVLFKLAYDKFSNDYDNAQKLILNNKILKENKDKIFIYQDEYYEIEYLFNYIRRFKSCFARKLTKKFLRDLINKKCKFYEKIPISIVITDE